MRIFRQRRASTGLILAVLAAGAAAMACQAPPRWVRRTPVLRLIYRPWGEPYWDNPKFSFDFKRNWRGPQKLEDGVAFTDKKLDSKVTVRFIPIDSKDYKDPVDFKRYMREQGAVEDTHLVDDVFVSSRPASRALFTTYRYDPAYELGAKYDKLYSEMVMVPDPGGLFLIRLDAPKPAFPRAYKDYHRFLDTMTLAAPDTEN